MWKTWAKRDFQGTFELESQQEKSGLNAYLALSCPHISTFTQGGGLWLASTLLWVLPKWTDPTRLVAGVLCLTRFAERFANCTICGARTFP
jgi:hypothetical protein